MAPARGRCFAIPASRAVLEEIEASRAIFTLYEGALFHHQGASYVVREVRFQERIALVERRAVPYWTRPHDYTDLEILHRRETKALGTGHIVFGDMKVRKVVYKYVLSRVLARAARAGVAHRKRPGRAAHQSVIVVTPPQVRQGPAVDKAGDRVPRPGPAAVRVYDHRRLL